MSSSFIFSPRRPAVSPSDISNNAQGGLSGACAGSGVP